MQIPGFDPQTLPHPFDTYGQFVDENEELLKMLPPSPVAVNYYEGGDLYMFDEFQTSRLPNSRRPKVNSLYDVFCNIRPHVLGTGPSVPFETYLRPYTEELERCRGHHSHSNNHLKGKVIVLGHSWMNLNHSYSQMQLKTYKREYALRLQ
ncbi:hypothetical protein CBR_g12323 [Chara braunii]|uniref:Uncharacterized protein n=1 Tax=Chara braunii TaxID=69332 RepID=A0A388KRR0_CHABU|nr:hypothetical protein CBR_g12323 [Chara braunii]|eukprot:GBG72755.1 hypothetical protein CBR_g12323 [Chara braunii]